MGKILSVAMPSYNVERYLEKGLNSFCDTRLEQGLEVLIVMMVLQTIHRKLLKNLFKSILRYLN